MRIYLAILVFFCTALISLAKDEGFPIIKNFEPTHYNGGSRIYSVAGKSNGILYVGDKTGVLEFDGEKWQKIDCGFPVYSLAIDPAGDVYLAGNQGIGCLKKDSVNSLKYQSLNHLVNSEGRVNKNRSSKVFEINGDIIFVLGNEILINSTERLKIIDSPYQFIYFQKLNNVLYLYSEENGIFKIKDDKLELVVDKEDVLNTNIMGFVEINGSHCAIDNTRGIISFNEGNIKTINSEINQLIAENNIRGVEQIDDSTFVFKTFYSGFFIVNSSGQIISKYNFKEGLINNSVFNTYKDNWGNLWVGTAAGISSIRLSFPFSIYNDGEGIGTGYSSVIVDGNIYLATSKGLYQRLIENNEVTFKKLFDGHVFSLHEIEGKVYFGHASGIYLLNGQSIKRITNTPGGWNIKKVPWKENVYYASTFAGMLLLELEQNKVLKSMGNVEGFHKSIRNFEFDSLKTVWAEFERGVLHFSLSNDLKKATNLETFDRIESGNQVKKVRKIHEEIYFLADMGIYQYNKENSEFEQDTIFSKLIEREQTPSNIIIDKDENLWVFCNEQLNKYRIKNRELKKVHYRKFNFADGSYPLDFENISYLNDHLVLIGQEQGFLCCDLSIENIGTYSSVIIREIKKSSKSGKTQNIWGKESFQQYMHKINIEEKIGYHENSIKFYYAAGCGNYNNIKYSTYLFGYDEKWSEWKNENIKEYTNLAPGNYRFLIRAVNRSSEYTYAASCDFVIASPWYLSTIAKILYGIALLALIWAMERIIHFRAKRVQIRLQKKQEERQFRKEQKQIQQNLTKEKEIIKLRNDKLKIDILYKSKELADSTMNIIKKNQFLTDLKNELEKIREYSEKNKEVTSDIRKVVRKIDRDIDNEENWKVFEDYFDRVHENFFKKMKQKHPILTAKDLRLCAYLRMNLSTKEIAPLLNITVRGVEIGRYRLRQKLQLDREENLTDYLLKI